MTLPRCVTTTIDMLNQKRCFPEIFIKATKEGDTVRLQLVGESRVVSLNQPTTAIIAAIVDFSCGR